MCDLAHAEEDDAALLGADLSAGMPLARLLPTEGC
jgi:hypothetical protein